MVNNLNPNQIQQKKQEAWRLFNTGEAASAYRVAMELYEAGAADAELTYLLGCCQATLGFYPKAAEYLEESLTYQSGQGNLPYTYIALAATANALSQNNKAIDYYQKALKLNPQLPDVHLGIAEVYLSTGDLVKAEDGFKRAAALIPMSGLPHFRLGHLEKKRENGDKALEYFSQAVKREPGVVDYQVWLGDTSLKMGLIEEAKAASSKALKLSPLNKVALGVFSAACARLGDYDEAMDTIDTALKENYQIIDVALAFLTVSKHFDRNEEAIEYAESCLALEKVADVARRNLHAQLALLLDHCQRYDEAWFHITECKKYKYALIESYDPITFKVAVDSIISTFTPATFLGLPRSTEKHEYAPVFIVGMPRSGTSLVEQILAAHPDVAACGELQIMNDIINEFSAMVNSEKSWPFCITDMNQEQVNEISREYINRLPAIKKQATFVTDKMPHNFFAIGLIQLLFPRTRVIHCRRQPLDTCISIYFANFQEGHEYSGNLFDIGAHYSQYLNLMEHWRQYSSIDIMEIDYESLVTDPETQIRYLLEYCELTWNENCLHFNKLKRKVKTASFDQVRQPIYTKSINRWKHYEKYLDSLKSGLERGY